MADSTISATTPTTISATFPYWAFTFATSGTGLLPYGAPTGVQPPIQCAAVGTKFRVRDDACQEASPIPSDRVSLIIPDLYAVAAEGNDPAITSALAALLAAFAASTAGPGPQVNASLQVLLTAVRNYGVAMGAL